MQTIVMPAREIPVIREADVCVVGGGSTGVFAAVTAARQGLRTVLVERQNCLGGVAAGGLVNVWHSLLDDTYTEQVIAGLTAETIERMRTEDAVRDVSGSGSVGVYFQCESLKFQLETLAREAGVEILFHTRLADVVEENGRVDSVTVLNNDGLGAVKAGFFIDATGDGALMGMLGETSYRFSHMQPPSACFLLQGNTDGVDLGKIIHEHGAEFGLDDDWGWYAPVPGMPGITMRADNHVFGVDGSRADDLTRAELTGRRQMHAFLALLKKYGRSDTTYNLVTSCSSIGLRDTCHYPTRFCATEKSLLLGERYEDAVLNGTYRVDIHHSWDNGITFRYLSGRSETIYGKDTKTVISDWRKEARLTGEPAHYYQVPFSLLVNERFTNCMAAGRMLHAEEGAFGALRVMVNLNQLGEAAGAAAYLALHEEKTLQELDGRRVRALLKKTGSAL